MRARQLPSVAPCSRAPHWASAPLGLWPCPLTLLLQCSAQVPGESRPAGPRGAWAVSGGFICCPSSVEVKGVVSEGSRHQRHPLPLGPACTAAPVVRLLWWAAHPAPVPRSSEHAIIFTVSECFPGGGLQGSRKDRLRGDAGVRRLQ